MDYTKTEKLSILFETLDNACTQIPTFLSWICDENAKSLLAITIVAIIFFSAFSILFSLNATKFTFQKVKYFIIRSLSEAYSEPKSNKYIKNLSPTIQLWIFRFFGYNSILISLISFIYAILFIYPVIFIPFSQMKYGVISYLTLISFGCFMAFNGAISLGMTRQYFHLTSAIKRQLL